MIHYVFPNLVKTVHLMLGYVHLFHYLLRYWRSYIEQKAQLIIELSDLSIGPGIFNWIEMLMFDCLNCKTNKSARKDLNKAA